MITAIVWPDFSSPEVWMSLITLIFLEIVLGIDNIIFISISSGKLPPEERRKATNVGLALAMILRIVLLLGITALTAMNATWFEINLPGIHGAVTGQSLILVAGGLFLLYKSTSEIHHKLEGDGHGSEQTSGTSTLSKIIMEITLINIVFSFDSILTAIGMTNGVHGALFIMIVAVVLSVLVMMLFAVPVGNFVNQHPSLQILGLSFLILIGFMLIVEGAHLAHFSVAGNQIGTVPKGYLYFAIAFSVGVEFLNLRMRRKDKEEVVSLHGVKREAVREGVLK